MTESIARRTQTAIAQQLVSVILMVGFAVVSARWLGPSGKGALTLVITSGFVAGSILGLGIPQALTAWVSGSRLSVRDALVLGAKVAVGMAVFTWSVTRLPFFASVNSINFLWLSVGAMLLEQVACGVSTGAGDLVPQLTLRLVGGGLQVTAMLVAWLVALPVSTPVVLAAYYGPGILGVATATAMLARRNPFRGAPGALPFVPKQFLAFGVAVIPAQLLSVMNLKLDVLVLGMLSDTSEVGIYSIAVSATMLAGLLPSAFGQALTRTFGTGTSPVASLRRGIHASLVAGILSAVMLAGTSPFLVPVVFGSGFARASVLILIMAPSTALFATVQVSVPYFYNHLKKPLVHSLVVGITATVDVALLVVLAPRYGAIGAAIASAVAYAVGAGLNIMVSARTTKLRVLDLLVPRLEDMTWMARTASEWFGREGMA